MTIVSVSEEKPAPYRVLVVDDEEDLRDIVAFALDLDGFITKTAHNGRAAFDLLQKEVFDLVVSDVRMPGGDGIELLSNIKMINPRLPLVVLTTGYADLQLEDAYDNGAEALFVKPFPLQELVGCVRKLLSNVDTRYSGRRDIRIAASLPIEILVGGAPPRRAVAANMSRGGIFAVTEEGYPPRGTQIAVTINDGLTNDGPIRLEGVVAWLRTGGDGVDTGCGVVFNEPSGYIKSRYFELLNGLKTTRVKA